MKITLSERMRDTIRAIEREAREAGSILDVYKAAQDVQKALPDENVALEDIVTALLRDTRAGFEAFEFDMRGMILEVVTCVPDGRKEVSDAA